MHGPGANVPGAVSDLALFLKTLVEEGRAPVAAQPLGDDVGLAADVLKQLDEHARNELALDAPRLSVPAGLWAARLFYQLCQFTVIRDIGEEHINAACAVACPEPREPETDWSVDLVLRHLPRLFQFARHLSNADPLVQHMKRIASEWPLSSVGIAGLENMQIESFISHPALARLYADRIVAEGDNSRLQDSRVADLLRADLGIHCELAPALATKLFSPIL